jgi:eukaryotic-like serine/threonine-protein kinase
MRILEMDARSDVWSLGAILYELLTLKRAYEGPHGLAVLLESTSGPPMDPRERAPERNIDDAIAETCLKAMAPDPADRYPSTMDLALDVGQYLESRRGGDEDCDDPFHA